MTDFIKSRLKFFRLTFLSLFYNDHISWNYVMDTMLEPLFFLVDNFTHILGPLLVAFVITMVSTVVFIAYYVGLPFYWNRSPYLAMFLVLFGNYFFINLVFHYYMGCATNPGSPPFDAELQEQISSICKKCIAPKPTRTHHCSVCHRCILKMDHHCPWMNNCIGHWNHRYFFLFMIYTVAGCFFLMVFGFEIVWLEVFDPSEKKSTELSIFSTRTLIMFETFITTGCVLFLGGLSLWHANLIHRGETSIEAHINKAECKRLRKLGKKYKNPYNFSPWHNWCLFLGMIEGRGWNCVLWPSAHKPKGNGVVWDSIYSCDIKWNSSHFYENNDLKIA